MQPDDPHITILPYEQRSAGARLREKVSRVVRMRSFWALADQGIASASNFVTVILIGRHLAPETFGAFALLWELLMFLNNLHAALIVYPLSVRGTKLDVDRLRQITTIGVIFTTLLAVPFGGAMFVMGAWQGLLIGIFAATAVMAFQLHETLRRSLMSHFLYSQLIWGDAVAYLGMAGTIVALAHLKLLSVPAVFATMTLTFLLASFVQAWHLQPARAAQEEVKPMATEFWVLGRWMLASNLTLLLTTIGVQWCLALFRDLTQVANLTALVNMIKITNPMLMAMSGLIVPAVAREGHARAGLRYAVLGFAILAPYFLVLFIAPEFSVGLFYGKNSEYVRYSMELRVAVATCVAGYIGAMMLAILMGLGRSKSNFHAQVANSLASVTIVLPAAIYWGFTGALVGGMIAMFITAVTALVLLLKALPHHRPQ